MHRVKVYKLTAGGAWDDKGTGLVTVGPMETSHHSPASMGLVVISEENQKTLMAHRISTADIYNRQDDTIITWTDADIGTDVALSFQEASGCTAVWGHIVRVQQEDPRRAADARRCRIDEFDGSGPHLGGELAADAELAGGSALELPAPEMGNLEEIAKVITGVPPLQRERMAQLLMGGTYLRQLLDLFRTAEDLEDAPSLGALYRIMRGAIMLNDAPLLEELLREEAVMDVMGCLEYDPDLPGPQGHRAFLQHNVVFKEVVPIASAEVAAKIHQTYRIQYLKDVILPRSLDDATYATLASLMLFNNVDVVLGLASDATFLPQLFSRLKQHAPGDAEWDDLVAFLQEFCSLAKQLQLQQRQVLWNKLVQLGLYDVVTRILGASGPAIKLRATDVLLSALAHDPMPLRAFLTQQPEHQLLGCLVAEFLASDDNGLAEQIAELLKLLADPETMEGWSEKNEFLEVFYDKFMDKLLAALSGPLDPAAAAAAGGANSPGGSAAGQGQPRPRGVAPSTIGLIVDLLCFCVQHHAYRAKYHILRKAVVEKVLGLLRRRERWLVVAAVRFMRTCIGTKDDFYFRHILRQDLLEPVMTAFFDNGERYNLLNSAVLDLVEFIRKENIKVLMEHLVRVWGHRFDEVTYVDTFRLLRLKWEQGAEGGGAGSGGPAASGDQDAVGSGGGRGGRDRRRRRDDRDMDKDEEDYFDSDGDTDQAAGPSPPRSQKTAAGPGLEGVGAAAAASPWAAAQPHAAEPTTAVAAAARGGGEVPTTTGGDWQMTLSEYGEEEEGDAAAIAAAAAAAAATTRGGSSNSADGILPAGPGPGSGSPIPSSLNKPDAAAMCSAGLPSAADVLPVWAGLLQRRPSGDLNDTGHAGLDGNGVSAFTRTKRIKIDLKQDTGQQGEPEQHLGSALEGVATQIQQHEQAEQAQQQQQQQPPPPQQQRQQPPPPDDKVV